MPTLLLIHWLLLLLHIKWNLALDNKTVVLIRQPAACLVACNVIRTLLGLPPFQLDPKITLRAEDWSIRIAYRSRMEQPQQVIGSNLYQTVPRDSSRGISCAYAVYYWFRGFEKLKQEGDKSDGTYFYLVHPSVKRVGFGTAYYKKKVYVTAMFGEVHSNVDDLKNLKWKGYPARKQLESYKSRLKTKYFKIPINQSDGWTDWIETTKCKDEINSGESIEERWCVNFKNDSLCNTDADGGRRRTIPCGKTLKTFY